MPLDSGEYDVTSQSTKGEKTYRVNGACECPDYAKAPEVKGIHFCKHKLVRIPVKVSSQSGQTCHPSRSLATRRCFMDNLKSSWLSRVVT